MENASKALIIAGAILLAILLITVGIIVIRAIDPVNQQAKDSAETMAIESYNAQFIKYEGEKVNGSSVKSLISTVRSSNAVHEKELKIEYVDSLTGETVDLLTSEAKIIPNGKYEVKIKEWGEDGYIKVMSVSGVKGFVVPGDGGTGDDSDNNDPTLETNEENITTNSATIIATGTDADGDTLTYTLYFNNETTYGPSTENTWDISDLTANTKYEYTVTVTDEKGGTATSNGEFTTEPAEKNEPPEIKSVSETNITETTATITAIATDPDNDTLTYTLEISTQKLTSSDGIWNVTGLEPDTYYQYEIIVTDGKGGTDNHIANVITLKENTAPTLTTSVSNEKFTTATITATGTDADGDTLTYTLEVNGKTYGPDTKNSWDITGLTKGTTYNYEVRVTDGKETGSATGKVVTDNIIIEVYEAGDITTNSANIKVKARSEKGYALKYQVSFDDDKTGLENGEGYARQIQNVPSGTEKTQKLEELSSNCKYYYQVFAYYNDATTVAEIYENLVSTEILDFGTNCPGNTLECDGKGEKTKCDCWDTVSYTDHTHEHYYYNCTTCGTLIEAGSDTCNSSGDTDTYRSGCDCEPADYVYELLCTCPNDEYTYDPNCTKCEDGYVYSNCEHNYSSKHNYCDHSLEGVEHTYSE